jgi:hypothetical protein
MHELINWLVLTIGALGYPGIFLLMASGITEKFPRS